MKNKFFKIPVSKPASVEAELNNFCSTHPINHVEKYFVPDGENSFWAIAVTYTDQDLKELPKDKRSTRIDYKEILSSDDFNIYAQLRDLRADISKEEGVPLYAIFSNEQISEMAVKKITTKTALLKIDKVGKSRADKYGAAFIKIVKQSKA
jgi:superfamily II DNA helicase RecQ